MLCDYTHTSYNEPLVYTLTVRILYMYDVHTETFLVSR